MLNPYRVSNGWNVGDDGKTYTVDGIDPTYNTVANINTISNTNDQGTKFSLFKLKSTCVDDESSAWLESFGDVNTFNFAATRPILMDGFVHNAEGFAKACNTSGSCSGSFTDTAGQRPMGYYDQGFLNYYYYMASNFAVSDRWFSPVASKTIDNRIATFTGGTTQGLVKDPANDDKLPQLSINTIFQELDQANVSWKVYYTVTEGSCTSEDDCPIGGNARFPAINFSELSYSFKYLRGMPSSGVCPSPMQSSAVVGDTSATPFCIDPQHIAPLSDATY
jgi:phospholipase C